MFQLAYAGLILYVELYFDCDCVPFNAIAAFLFYDACSDGFKIRIKKIIVLLAGIEKYILVFFVHIHYSIEGC